MYQKTDEQISPAFYRTLSLFWGHCPKRERKERERGRREEGEKKAREEGEREEREKREKERERERGTDRQNRGKRERIGMSLSSSHG